MPRTLSIVVPTYNERDRLSELVEDIFRVLRANALDGEIVVVDDNSPDGTGDLAESLGRVYPMQVVRRAGKRGLGSAVIAGFAVARGDVLGVLDADLSHPPALLPAMFAAIARGADVVVGSRYVPGGSTRHWSAGRILLSRAACVLARPLTQVRDATSGFFLLRREVIEDVAIVAGGFKICLELLVRGHARLVVEIPYCFVGRTAGASKMNVWEALGYLRQLRQLMAWKWRFGTHVAYERLPPQVTPEATTTGSH
jgi:dolichol-phosphate mannosyltransferase